MPYKPTWKQEIKSLGEDFYVPPKTISEVIKSVEQDYPTSTDGDFLYRRAWQRLFEYM